MKNVSLYKEHAIEGWPCFYFTVEAADKYNSQLEKFCNELPDGANNFLFNQKVRRFFYLHFLIFYDSIIALKDSVVTSKHKGE